MLEASKLAGSFSQACRPAQAFLPLTPLGLRCAELWLSSHGRRYHAYRRKTADDGETCKPQPTRMVKGLLVPRLNAGFPTQGETDPCIWGAALAGDRQDFVGARSSSRRASIGS